MFSRIKRWTVRLIGVGILIAAGMVSFRVAKTWPRCVISSDTQAIHFSADGATLITGHELICIGNVTGGGSGAGKPPLQVWNTRSGKLVRSLLNDVETFKRHEVCEKRTLIAVAVGGTIRFADWQTGEEWNIEVGPGELQSLTFSPRGDLLSVRAEGHPQPQAMIDLERRAIVQRFEREARGSWFNADGSRWYYHLRGRMHAWNTTTHEVEAEVAEGSLYAEDRFYVHRSAENLDLVLRDGASLAEKVRFRLAPPPEFRAVKSIDAKLRRKIHDCRHIAFSPSGRRAATFAQPYDAFDGVLEIWDTGTGQQVAAFPELKRGWGWFRVDDDLFVFMDRSHTPRDATTVANLGDRIFDVVTMVDLASGMIRWRIPTNQFAAIYVLRKDTAVHATREGTWEIFDAVTGESRCSQPHPFAAGAFVAVDSKDQRLVYAFGKRRAPPLPAFWDKWLGKWLGGTSGGVQVLDTVSDRIIFDLHTDAGIGAVLSEDGRTLLTQNLGSAGIGFGRGRASGSPHFRFYDLHSMRPWFWAASVAAGLLGLAWLWRRWRVWRKRGTTESSTGLVPLPDNGPAH